MARVAHDANMCGLIGVLQGDAQVAKTTGHRLGSKKFWEHLLLKLCVCLRGSQEER
jgi:hypothetical protein